MTWRCTGVRWDGDTGTPLLGWQDGGRTRQRVLRYGETLGFRVVGERRCPGVWRGGNQVPCAVGAVVGARAVSDRCEECARLDRARSVAADTYADDPRPYRVYLAWFGRGMVKVGITRADRGPARLLEQGAVAFVWLGTGPLMAARRAEELLRAALGVPDRVPYDRKRAVRADLPGPEVRAAELRALRGVAVALPGWPESLERTPGGCAVVDHGEVFSTAGLPPATSVVTELRDGGVVRGVLVAAAGPDLHLRVDGWADPSGSAGAPGRPDARGRPGASGRADAPGMPDAPGRSGPASSGGGSGRGGPGPGGRRVVVLDGRLMSGWELVRDSGEMEYMGDAAADGTGHGGRSGRGDGGAGAVTVPVRDVSAVQGGLF
ncbi:DUF2797 domain-containing protein [Streptomyces uncialis]|uniref:DUF2797 domain-containing protein n=1 Tax=Streptomyces uncialis TaxID=1048205 RepID=UPI0037B7453A